MDTLRGPFSTQDETDEVSPVMEDTGAATPPAGISSDERRMQMRAYNFWASLLGNRTFPDVSLLDPEYFLDFGPFSVLLDFTDGVDNPAIGYLGEKLAEECGTQGPIERLNDVPPRSLLSRITDHYMQILANQAPVGFEAEFVNQRGVTILYRGILLPFSRDDVTIDHIYGVINWKELADQSTTDELMKQVDEAIEARPSIKREAEPMSEWADGPVELGVDLGVELDADDIDPESPSIELPLAQFGMHGDYFNFDDNALGAAEQSEDGEGDSPDPAEDDAEIVIDSAEMSLADWLKAARTEAQNAITSEDRSRRALYDAIGRAYDFALAAAEAPEDFATLVREAGLKVQERAPLIPLVKLVFGIEYDKTRLTEFATVIAHGQRLDIAPGGLSALLSETSGGLKGLVREERRLRREESGKAERPRNTHETLVEGLRQLQPRSFESVGRDSEFAVLVARRLDDGQLVLLGEVSDDEALLDRAARHLLD
ncbi:hypothetical protein [Novosphingobium mangrovi (ex Huang et al. 2023)]|uniref:PAS domain-containing protein n=1 Tax=Novosphingobium mangrovi (ex Huang et al. 2023) TaxID=2976432 RepID=A0ABT2I9R7_9SPHN|nr:hypothetical protein [Novosphingobium mangrovi (ex Huang et al. 2023)]MCT2401574.1 hypothetical protein [Novosphingobium mangrovi (ex Huang et al. 2023)]